MGKTAIQWADYTFNSWEGCTKVAPECKNCYAETLVDHRFGRVKWGKGQQRRRTSAAYWKQPLRWNKEIEGRALCNSCGYAELIGSDDCRNCGLNFSEENRHRPRVFCLSLGDWLDEEVPVEWLADLLRLIHNTPNLDWLLLTKRPQYWKSRITKAVQAIPGTNSDYDGMIGMVSVWVMNNPPPNVWIGVSAGADLRAALDIPAKIHFLSCEPMLKPLDDNCRTQEFDWIIFGGESGKNARPCHIDWIREGLKFCREFQVSPFVKQLGAHPIFDRDETQIIIRDSHGGNWDEWPEDLRVREFPKAA